MNHLITLRYDGTAYHGWQRQENAVTVQQRVEEAIAKLFGEEVTASGCSRTDTGVHANCFKCNFRTEKVIPDANIISGLNFFLPDDIAVYDSHTVADDFNARFNCVSKEYIYKIYNSNIRDPFLEKRVCFYPQHLDLSLMERAANAFVGTHDFRAVRSVGTETKTTVRTVHWCRVEKDGCIITVSVCADGFLYNMCRAIVGTLVYASYGKLIPEDIPLLLEKGDRRLTGPTMPPQGLYLNRVWYDGEVGEMFLRD